jgi:hypothetical protein
MNKRRIAYCVFLMASCSELLAMICVQTKDMPVMLSQTFINASPVLRDIQKDPLLQGLKMRSVFGHQSAYVVARVMQDQAALTSGSLEDRKEFNPYCGHKDMACYIALVRLLKLDALLAVYRQMVRL